MSDYYAILGVSPVSSKEEIRKAYRQLAMKYHPDRNQGDAWAAERFKEIAEFLACLFRHLHAFRDEIFAAHIRRALFDGFFHQPLWPIP